MGIRQHIFFALCMLLVAGLFLMDIARVVPSIAMIGIVLLALTYVIKPASVKSPRRVWPWLAISGTFIILLPSWFYSDNIQYLLEKWQVALPFLVLPLAFMMVPSMPAKRYQQLYEFYFLLVFITSLNAFIYYLLHQDHVNALYLASKVMPTFPVSHHPTFSVMVAFAIFIAYRLISLQYGKKPFNARTYFFIGAGIFLFIFIHVYSVRSGLLAFYVLTFAELSRIAIRLKQIKAALLTAVVLIVVGGGTLLLSPTFSNKLTNTAQDISAMRNNQSANNKSLASRMISYRNAVRIMRESSWFAGCGLGDINDLNNAIFRRDYPEVSRAIIPHNQFLFYLAALGISGVLVFIFCFFYPLVQGGNYRNTILLAHYIVMFVYFMVEAPLETQIGVCYTILFILLPLHKEPGDSL